MGDDSHIVNPDLVYEDNLIFSIISLHWWTNNPGHALVIPKRHIENLYGLPGCLSDRIHRFSRYLALALKSVFITVMVLLPVRTMSRQGVKTYGTTICT